jgi:uncharacterized membrane protein YhaH (DUF805 family)
VGPVFLVIAGAISIAIEAVMMVVMMVMVIPVPSRRYHDHARSISTPAVMMVVMVVLTDNELRNLHVFIS